MPRKTPQDYHTTLSMTGLRFRSEEYEKWGGAGGEKGSLGVEVSLGLVGVPPGLI